VHGFSGGTYPSPNGAPNQGLQKDPDIVNQFNGWFDDHAGRSSLNCTTIQVPWAVRKSTTRPAAMPSWRRCRRSSTNQVLPEVRAPLPASLNNAQEQGLADMRQLAAIRGG
jgi:hypothetical protein